MNEVSTIPNAPAGNSLKMLRAMVGIGILCALMIVLTFEGTLPIIKQNQAEALQRAIFEVLPGTAATQPFQLEDGTFTAVEGERKEGEFVYAGYGEDGTLTGVAIEARGQGYADIIRILYGYDPEAQTVVGFRVLESKETPGLGDKIEKAPHFLANFEALDVSLNEDRTGLANEVVTVKQGEKEQSWQVEGITGATISSRTIGDIINKSAARWAPLISKNTDALAQAARGD